MIFPEKKYFCFIPGEFSRIAHNQNGQSNNNQINKQQITALWIHWVLVANHKTRNGADYRIVGGIIVCLAGVNDGGFPVYSRSLAPMSAETSVQFMDKVNQ